MDKREALKSMLNNLINDKPEEASLDLHNFMTSKMREVSGLAGATAAGDDSGADALENDESNPAD